MVRAAKNEAILAVKLYNEPLLERSLEGFVVHMHMAWLYLLQAEFLRDGVDFRYPHPNIRGRFKRIDGEYSTWDLERCAKERWTNPSDPVKANLQFFIKFRNKTEHRHKGNDAALFAAIADKSQAMLLNFEEELTSQFGSQESLAEQLRFPVFIGTFTEPAEDALRRLNQALPTSLKKFLADHDTGIDDSVLADSRYSLRLKVQLQPAQRGEPDIALSFVRADELTTDQLTEVGQTGTMIIKERAIPVANMGNVRFRAVEKAVAAGIPFVFNQAHLTAAIRAENIRPNNGDPNPSRTRAEFCTYDEMNKVYGYKQAYIDHLIRQLSTEEGFRRLTSRPAVRTTGGAVVETNTKAA